MTENQPIQARISENTFQALLDLSRQSTEFRYETIKKALSLYLEALSDPNNRILIVNDVSRTEKKYTWSDDSLYRKTNFSRDQP